MSSLEDLIHRRRPSPWLVFLQAPCLFIARWIYLYASKRSLPSRPITNALSVVCISDTHNKQPPIPESDILIHAGDLTQSGSFAELQTTVSWLRSLPHPHKIVIAGNHDTYLDPNWGDRSKTSHDEREEVDWGDIIYLRDERHTLKCANGRHITVYGSPWTPKQGNWAFQYPRAVNIWNGKVPREIDILVTHGPPRGHLDLLKYGCVYLLEILWQLQPKLHVFGHIHEGYGSEWLPFDGLQKAFEKSVIDGGGASNLFWVAWEFLKVIFMPRWEAQTMLVNAAMVGGLRDDLERQPAKILI
ncbi:hypothetical protein TrVFT333_000029 [Trichoderma virens FT-333]|nr:hypothetical protein TrVFT333_000029 [Trichoderma virens FT-333]